MEIEIEVEKSPERSRSSKPRKEPVSLVFIGHVDSGKSTICGQIMNLTGMVDKRTLEKYAKEAKEDNRATWYLSRILDTNEEERKKGKTVEVGRAYFETIAKHFTVLDAPGHRGFVPNMMLGVAQADLAVLVVSTRKGEFETGFVNGGQTREHAMLVKAAGVKFLIVLMNKMDDPTVEWDEGRFNECRDKLTPFLVKRLGFKPGKDLTFIPCSGLTGAGLASSEGGACPWYKGLPFIPFLDSLPPFQRHPGPDAPFIFPIVCKYRDKGLIVMGKVESGEVCKGQALVAMPNRTPVTVEQLWTNREEVEEVKAGEVIKIKLRGKGTEEDLCFLGEGFVLCTSINPCSTGKIFDAQVVILEHNQIISAGYSAVMHIHSASVNINILGLLCLIDKKTGEKLGRRPPFVRQDQVAIMRLESVSPVCMEKFSSFSPMGRFTLRDQDKTIAVGKVLKILS